jgi:hypothetical protein
VLELSNSTENQEGNPLGGKRGLNNGTFFPSQGSSNLQRAALGDIKNVASSRHNSVSTDEPSKDFKQPLATRRFDLLKELLV